MSFRTNASYAVLGLSAVACAFALHWSYFKGPSFDVWAQARVGEAKSLARAGDVDGARSKLAEIGTHAPAREAFELGRFYRDGLLGDLRPNADIDAAKAAFAEASAAKKDKVAAKAMLELARILDGGATATPTDIDTLLVQASELGDRRASTLLAQRMLRSDSAPVRQQAMRLLWQASWTESTAALVLARLYTGGGQPPPTRHVVNDLVERAKLLLADGARAGAVGDMMSLGRFLREDDLGQQDLPSALAWFQRAAAAGALQGLVDAADLLLSDNPKVANVVAGAESLHRAAVAGSPESAYRFGMLHLEGQLPESDPAIGKEWLEKAAERGSAAAMVFLAKPLLTAEPGTPELERGIQLAYAASKAGSAVAAYQIGLAIETGRLDAGPALKWYELAAQRGNRQAMGRLVDAHRSGDIAQISPEREMYWIKRSLENGGKSTSLMRRLGESYLNGTHGLDRDLQQSAHWFELAAERGSSSAMLQIAEAYANGGGVPLDAEKAVYWYKRAAEKGSLKALDQLARAYASGFGVRLDAVEAFRLFLRAARLGSVFGQRETGRAYAIGFGIEADPERSIEFYEVAAAGGDTEAMLELSYAYRHGYGTVADPDRAVVWIRRAATSSDKNAQFLLGRAYLEGDQVPKDPAMARQWFESAAQLGSGDAERFLAQMNRDRTLQGAGG